MKLILRLALILLALSCQPLSADEPDVELSMTTTFTLAASGESYRLSSKTDVTRTYLSKRSTSITNVSIGEQFFDSIVGMRAMYKGRDLPAGRFGEETARGSDVFISNLRVRTIDFPGDIAQGDQIWYSYSREYSSPAFLPVVTLPNINYIKEYRIVINHPDNVTAEFDFFFPQDSLSYRIDRSDKEMTVLEFTDITSRPALPNFPYNDMRGAVQIRMLEGGTSLNPTGIADFAGWYMELFDQKPALEPAFADLLKDDLKGAKSDLEKIRIIYDHVRSTIRYIADEGAMHAFVPRDPSLVLKRGYGDCKDRAYLVAALARREGIKVDMALLSTVPTPKFAGTHVSQFNHVICAYKHNGRWIFFDPTHKYCEFGNLPDGDIGRPALVLDADSPELVEIAAPNTSPAITIGITASLGAPQKGKALITMRNDLFHLAAESLEKKTELERENILSNIVTGFFNKISFDYFTLASRTDSTITFESKADLSDFMVSSSSKTYLSQMPFRLIDPEMLGREGDTYAIYNDNRMGIVMNINLDIAGHTADSASLAFGGRNGASFNAGLTRVSSESVTLEYEVRHLAKRIDGNDRPPYIEFCRSFLKSKKNMFVFTRKQG